MPRDRLPRTTVITLRLYGWALAVHILDVELWRVSGRCQVDVGAMSGRPRGDVIYCRQVRERRERDRQRRQKVKAYTITSDTQTQGRITKRIKADTYPDALAIVDHIVDELDGHYNWINNPPMTLSFDELFSGQYGEFHNYVEKFARWYIILKTGWYYKGDAGLDTAHRCGVLERLDTVYF